MKSPHPAPGDGGRQGEQMLAMMVPARMKASGKPPAAPDGLALAKHAKRSFGDDVDGVRPHLAQQRPGAAGNGYRMPILTIDRIGKSGKQPGMDW
jgi:hypothetical protein